MLMYGVRLIHPPGLKLNSKNYLTMNKVYLITIKMIQIIKIKNYKKGHYYIGLICAL
jgi:hypothetical protein